MNQVLHIITRTEDALARELMSRQRQSVENKVEIVDLNLPEADYKGLLEKIFAADSIECW